MSISNEVSGKPACRLLLGIICFGLAIPAAEGSPGQGAADPEPLRTITVRVANNAMVPEKTLADGQKVAEQILAKAGVGISWVRCPAGRIREIGDRCRQALGPTEFSLQMLQRRPRNLRGDTAGFAVVSPGEEKRAGYAGITYPTVEETANTFEVDVRIVLGAVVAHELGHLLLGSNAHSPGGIMRARLRWRDFLLASQGNLLFTPEQIARIRFRVSAISAEPKP